MGSSIDYLCTGCGNYDPKNPEKQCSVATSDEQTMYANDGKCGWAIVDGKRIEKKSKYCSPIRPIEDKLLKETSKLANELNIQH
jgi:hypothetical protein